MNDDKVRQIIKEELAYLIRNDRFTFNKLIQVLDGRNIQLGRTTGTKIGTGTDQLLGFYGTTPVDQPTAAPYANDQGGTYNQTDVQSITTAVNAVIDRLQELGLTA